MKSVWQPAKNTEKHITVKRSGRGNFKPVSMKLVGTAHIYPGMRLMFFHPGINDPKYWVVVSVSNSKEAA